MKYILNWKVIGIFSLGVLLCWLAITACILAVSPQDTVYEGACTVGVIDNNLMGTCGDNKPINLSDSLTQKYLLGEKLQDHGVLMCKGVHKKFGDATTWECNYQVPKK